MNCETVKIVAENEQGFIIINKDDFDKSKHTLYKENKTRNQKE